METGTRTETELSDPIPLEDSFELLGPNEAGMMTGMFYAFNTVITLQAFESAEVGQAAFREAKSLCRIYEREFSRTLPHSDISRINTSAGAEVLISKDTYELLSASQRYCEQSGGIFDITMGAVSRLWDFQNEKIPDAQLVSQALQHVDWRFLVLRKDDDKYFAQLEDPQAAIDVGGTAKGYIADRLGESLEKSGVESFIVNLGGNVLAKGRKPGGALWRIGLQDPKDKQGILGAIELENASAVTSGIYERCFLSGGHFYHHILDPETGFPVDTDVAGVTVVAERSIDAEGYSTTLLALGVEAGSEFVKLHPEIHAAYFVDHDQKITIA